jgi:hypothetical protein
LQFIYYTASNTDLTESTEVGEYHVVRIFIISVLGMDHFGRVDVAITCSMHGELISCKFTEHFYPDSLKERG